MDLKKTRPKNEEEKKTPAHGNNYDSLTKESRTKNSSLYNHNSNNK